MRCPRCTLAELPDGTETCVLCGYSSASVAVAEAPPPPPPPAQRLSPTELDARRELARDFRIDSLLDAPTGQIVYLARDSQDRPIALKVVPRTLAGAGAGRFDGAATGAAKLDHPHIVPIYGHGATDNFLWCATKHVEGRALGSILRGAGPIELGACLRIFEQVASALDYAHRRGVAHGALTPDCIIVDANQWALLNDFAWTGVLETPNSPIDADQPALAAVVHECLTGSPPRDGRRGAGEPPDEGGAKLPLAVSQALRRAMSKRPADRFSNVLDFVAALGGDTARPDGRKAWFSTNPRKTRGSGPVVILDSDTDPRASRLGRRIGAVLAGLVIVGGGGAAWLGISSIPAAPTPPPTRPRSEPPPAVHPSPAAREPAPDVSAVPPPSSAGRDTEMSSPPPSSPRAAPPRRVESPPQRATAPAVEPPPVTPAPRPALSGASALVEPGLLSINAIPWGSVFLDGQPIGNTPQIDRTVQPGQHRLRVEREGYKPYDRMIQVAPGQRLRITDIALVER